MSMYAEGYLDGLNGTCARTTDSDYIAGFRDGTECMVVVYQLEQMRGAYERA